MKSITFDVRDPKDSMADFLTTWRSGEAQIPDRISFAKPELLWKVLTAKRWELLKALCGAGPLSIRELARRVERDVKAVHRDVTAFLAAGVLERTESLVRRGDLGVSPKRESGSILFAFDTVKIEFVLEAA